MKELLTRFTVAIIIFLFDFFIPIWVSGQEFALRERLRTHTVFIKDLNYYKFSIKSYVIDVY